jgi:hypothetical protein
LFGAYFNAASKATIAYSGFILIAFIKRFNDFSSLSLISGFSYFFGNFWATESFLAVLLIFFLTSGESDSSNFSIWNFEPVGTMISLD